MDPLRLIEIAQDGDFQRVRQLAQEYFPLSPASKVEEIQKRQKKDHPWKSPMERYRNKQLDANEDEDLEELSWKHRSKFYDLTRSDVTSKRVYHTDDDIDHSKQPSTGGLPPRYTEKRPMSIETTAKLIDEAVITPATVPMDEDEFLDSPYDCSTPPNVTLIDASPSVVTPPKAILDQLALDQKEMEGTEITLERFEEEREQERMDGAVKKVLEQRSGVRKLIEEHERLMAETKKTMAVPTEVASKPKSMVLRKFNFSEKQTISPQKAMVEMGKGNCTVAKVVNQSVGETKTLSLEEYQREIDEKVRQRQMSRTRSIIIEDEEEGEEEEEEEDETYLLRSSILTTIVEESTPRKVSSPLTMSPEKVENDSESIDTWKHFRSLNIVTPEKAIDDSKVTYTRKEFKEKRITPLNKVTIAAALIEYNEILMEVKKPLYGGKITNNTRLIQAIMKHRKQNGFFTDKTPTHESMKNGAATIIQAAGRQFLAMRYARRRVEAARNFAAMLIQSQWRTYDCQMNYKWHREAAIMLQAQWKSWHCRKQYNSLLSSVISVQSIARMFHCKTVFLQQKRSAKIVQTQWRSVSCRKQYNSMRSSAILVQSFARMHQCRTKYLQARSSTLIAQAKWRSYACQKRFNFMRSSSISIQSIARMYNRRTEFVKQKASLTSIQAASRMFLCRSQYLDCKKAVTTLQSISRMHLRRMKFTEQKSAATKLQATQRMNLCRSNYVQFKNSATKVQSVFRMCLSRQQYLKQKSASTTLQSASRMYLGRTIYLKQQRAAITLQGMMRMHLARGNYLVHKSAALVVQDAFREYMRQKDHDTFEALREVQARWRSSISRSDHATLMEIKKIPTSRRTSICKRNFMQYLSSSIIQKGWRNYHQRKTFEAARCIQARWRSFVCQKEYDTKVMSAIYLQASLRGFLCRKNFVSRKLSASRIQERWRSYNCRRTYVTMLASATLLQSSYRAYVCQKNHRLMLASTVKLQSAWRSYSCKKDYLRMLVSNRAATKLGSIVRMYLWRTVFLQYRASRTIQTAFRAYVCRKEYAIYLDSVKMNESQQNGSTIDVDEDDTLLGRSSMITTAGDDIEIDDDNDGEIFLARSSILTTVVEERASLPFGSPSEFSHQYSDESEDEALPTTVKKERPNVFLEEEQNAGSNEANDFVPVPPKNDPPVQIRSRSELEKDRRTSEERLLALAAKVAAKRRASLNRNNRPEAKTKDPWQQKMEAQKKSKPVLLSKRMGELEKLARQKRVTSSIWNTKEEQNTQALDVIDENKPLARYPDVTKDDDKNDSVVKKLFEFDNHDDVVSQNSTETTDQFSQKGMIIDQEINVHFEESDKDEVELAIDPESDFVANENFPDGSNADTQYLETFLDENTVPLNEESASDVEYYDDNEQNDVARTWKRLSIVDDLAEDIYEFDTDSDSDDDQADYAGKNVTGDGDPFLTARIENQGPSPRSIMMEWHVVNDLVGDEDVQYDEAFDSEDEDYEGNGCCQDNEGMSLSKIQKENPLWSMSRENVSEALSTGLYTVAGVAASLIGMGE